MGLIRKSCFIVFAVILFLWVSTSSSQTKKNIKDQVLLNQLVDPSSGQFDNNLVEELLFKCKLDLIQLNGAFERLRSPNEDHQSTLSNTRAKQTLLACLQKHKAQSPISTEEVSGPKSWYSNYLETVFKIDNVTPRRYLQTLATAPSPGPTPGPARSPSAPPTQAPTTQFFPPITDNRVSVSPPPSGISSSNAGPVSNQTAGNHSSGHKRAVVIAVTLTALITFFCVGLLFLCCGGYLGPGSKGQGQNDHKPLLSLSLSDFSFGRPAQQPFHRFGNGNSMKEDGIDPNSYSYHNSPARSYMSSTDGSFHVPQAPSHNQSIRSGSSMESHKSNPFTLSSDTNPPLKPPPSRVSVAAPAPTAKPPLRPPPGRAEPLPHEPPYSFKPPTPRPTPPPPPPPPAPPVAPPPPRPPPPPGPRPPPPPGPRPPPPPRTGAGPPPPPPPRAGGGPPPPPPPRGVGGAPPPRPPGGPLGLKAVGRPPPLPPKHPPSASSSVGGANSSDDESDAPKAKLKPFFWDKVMANPDHSMVWHQIKSGSFQFDENMIESLFGYAATDKAKAEQKKQSSSQDPSTPQFIQIIDAKKAQNLAILLRALNVTIEEVCDALLEGHELPAEFVENILKMTPTTDEELKLRLFNGDPSQLGTAERFLKALVDIPFGFKRLEALLFMSTLAEDVLIVKESFETLEVACKELRNSRLFLKLLEAVLKTGNRMNDGTFRGGAQAFKLDTLLKLSDVKGTDGKTTLLLFVVQEIIRSEGIRASRLAQAGPATEEDSEENYRALGLKAVSSLHEELENVRKASVLDAETLTGTVAKLGQSLLRTRQFLNSELRSDDADADDSDHHRNGFRRVLRSFVKDAEAEIMAILEEEKRIMALVKSAGDYFHGSSGKDEGLRLFVVVREFLVMVDRTCREVAEAGRKAGAKLPKKETSAPDLRQLATAAGPTPEPRQSVVDLRDKLFPAIADRRRTGDSSSDDES